MNRAAPILAAILLPCLAAADSVIEFSGDAYQATLLNPGAARREPTADCRFFRAGWLLQLRPAGAERGFFRTRPILARHPVSGCGTEFLPSLALGLPFEGDYEKRLKIGVGIIREHRRNLYHTYPVTLFPWQSRTRTADGQTIHTAIQRSGNHAGYGYELTVATTFYHRHPQIEISHRLRNTGTRELAGKLYLHPFLEAEPGFPGCQVTMPHPSGAIRRFAVASAKSFSVAGAERLKAETPAGTLVLESPDVWSQADFWSNGEDCFAVEPYTDIKLAPGETANRNWVIRIERATPEK